MEKIKQENWISGEQYKKKILVDDIKDKISLIEEAVIEPHGEVPMHAHEVTDELFYFVEGEAVMIVDGQEFRVGQGDMVFVEHKEMHGFKNNSNKEFKLICCKMNFKKGDSYLE